MRRALLAWYRSQRRDLPWRRTRDPYAIWVAETMLQQTRVETVEPYYERFLARFPDLHTLACADLDDILGLWAGLGYYTRARHLRAAARQVIERHGGRLPADLESLQALPGVGRYTAGAVASIAFGRPAPVVDGNVARVLSRLLELHEPIEERGVQERLWREAQRLARGAHPGDLNQALMELGARICTPGTPDCPSCPIQGACAAAASGAAPRLPQRRAKRPPLRLRRAAVLLVRRGRALAVRRPPRGLLGGLWELPGADLGGRERPETAAIRAARETVGLEADALEPVGIVAHAFTHRRMRLHVFRARAEKGQKVRLAGFDAHRWVGRRAWSALPAGTLTRKAVKLALGP